MRARVRGDEVGRQHDVVVNEQHDLARGRRDAHVARQCPVRLRFEAIGCAVPFGNRARIVARAVVDDDRFDLRRAELRAQRRQRSSSSAARLRVAITTLIFIANVFEKRVGHPPAAPACAA